MASIKKTKDHWDFLEEIEAPMWVDLTLEAKSNNQQIDDEWFRTSHPFHQYSSHQLKSAFSCSGEWSTTLDFELQGPSSPKLPPSVSRSRGKHYTNKKWRGDNCDISLSRPHPVKVLSEKPSQVDSGSTKEIKPKLSFINSKGTSSSKISMISETRNAKGNHLKPTFTCGASESESTSSWMMDKAGQSNTTSTVTSEGSHQQQQKFREISSRTFDQTSGLLAAMRVSLRKSCVTRQASRVEITNDRRQSRDRKSSSSKSSVGSSSNPGNDAKSSSFSLIRSKERTPDSRNVARLTEAAKNKVKVSKVSKAPTAQVKEGNFISRRGHITNIAKSAHQETAKSKVQCQTLRAKSSLSLRVSEKNSFVGNTKARQKVGVGKLNRLVGAGKENATGTMAASLKCSGTDNAAGDLVRGKKGTKQFVAQKGERTRLVGTKGKISDQSEGKISMNVNQRVYLR